MKLPRWISPETGSSFFRFAILALVAGAFTGCETCHNSNSDWREMWLEYVDQHRTCHKPGPERWTREELAGNRLTLKDIERVESYLFDDDGEVHATIGQKHDFADRTFCWKIHDGRLQIFDHKHCLYEDLTLLSMDGPHVLAQRRNGHLLQYELSPGLARSTTTERSFK
jgi:hypothetical protein